MLRSKRPKRIVSAMHRAKAEGAARPDEVWSMDFMSDAFFDGRRPKLMTVVDSYTRESLAIEAGQGIAGEQVTEVLEKIARDQLVSSATMDRNLRQRPWTNGPMNATLNWTFPGRESLRTTIYRIIQRSFQGRMPQCELVLSLEDAQRKVEAWRLDYNESRPHSSLGNLTPIEFAIHSGQLTGMDGLERCRELTQARTLNGGASPPQSFFIEENF